MELFFRKLGTGEPVVILHGLYGSSDNWYTIGRALADEYEVFLVDLRNHGQSPHHPEHNYRAMRDDLTGFFTLHHLDRAIFLGHSMGGKAALDFGLHFPEKVKKMILVDISPFAYDLSVSEQGASHLRIVEALLTIHPETLVNREEADTQLQKFIPSLSVRQFLIKSLKRDTAGRFYWGLNIPVLAENLPGIFSGIIPEKENDPFAIPHFPLLFIKGEKSDYISEKHEAAIRHYLPWSQIVTIPGAGHWVHAEQPAVFISTVKDFLNH